MKLQRIYYVVGIIAAIVAVLTYFEIGTPKKPESSTQVTKPSLIKPETTKPPEAKKSEDGTPPGSRKEQLIIAFEAGKGIYDRDLRDNAFQKIVINALEFKEYELAIEVAGNIYSRDSRDIIYMDIVVHAIRNHQFNIAKEASEHIYSRPKRDKAKRMIIDAIGPSPSPEKTEKPE